MVLQPWEGPFLSKKIMCSNSIGQRKWSIGSWSDPVLVRGPHLRWVAHRRTGWWIRQQQTDLGTIRYRRLRSLVTGFPVTGRSVAALASGRGGGGELCDPPRQRVCAFEKLHGRDSGSSTGRLAAFLLEQGHEVLVAGARPLTAAQRQVAEVAAAAAVLHRGHQALPAAKGVRRLLTAQNLSFRPGQREAHITGDLDCLNGAQYNFEVFTKKL